MRPVATTLSFLTVACLAFAGLSFACAQDEVQAPNLHPISVAIRVPVSVRDRKGDLVPNLTKDDFSLQVSGKDQKIQTFDPHPALPFTVGLLVDVGRNRAKDLDHERKVSKEFLDSFLKPEDKAFVMHFVHDIELLQDVTSDHAKIDKAVAQLGSESATFHTATDEGAVDSEQRKVHGHGTSLYDSVFLAGDEILSHQQGRKVILLLTDGIDAGSKDQLTEAIEAAQRADTAVYAIYFRSTDHDQQRRQDQQPQQRRSGGYPGGGGGYPTGTGGYPGGGGNGYPGSPGTGNPGGNNPNNPNGGGTTPRKASVDGKQVLDRLCGETGGHVFEVSKREPIEDIYNQISEELRGQYMLTFGATPEAAKAGYHQIDLRLTGPNKDKKFDVQAREGYYIGSN